MIQKIHLTDEQERAVTELTEWLFGDEFTLGEPEHQVVCEHAIRLGLEQMHGEMMQCREIL